MNDFFTDLKDNFSLILDMGPADIADVLIVAAAVYGIIRFMRRTNSMRVAQGIFLLLIATWLATTFHLSLTSFILQRVFEIGILTFIILFQPEIRRALERMGSASLFSLFGRSGEDQSMERTILQTVYACEDMSRTRTGALIVFERKNRLNEVAASGTALDARISAELLKNIFFDKTPLHDGAVLVRDGRLAAAACMLPLSENNNLSRDLGMRHRAGIGMSERSDAVVVIVSEETGGISVAEDGLLKRHLSPDTFEQLLRQELMPQEETEKPALFARFRKRKGGSDEE